MFSLWQEHRSIDNGHKSHYGHIHFPVHRKTGQKLSAVTRSFIDDSKDQAMSAVRFAHTHEECDRAYRYAMSKWHDSKLAVLRDERFGELPREYASEEGEGLVEKGLGGSLVSGTIKPGKIKLLQQEYASWTESDEQFLAYHRLVPEPGGVFNSYGEERYRDAERRRQQVAKWTKVSLILSDILVVRPLDKSFDRVGEAPIQLRPSEYKKLPTQAVIAAWKTAMVKLREASRSLSDQWASLTGGEKGKVGRKQRVRAQTRQLQRAEKGLRNEYQADEGAYVENVHAISVGAGARRDAVDSMAREVAIYMANKPSGKELNASKFVSKAEKLGLDFSEVMRRSTVLLERSKVGLVMDVARERHVDQSHRQDTRRMLVHRERSAQEVRLALVRGGVEQNPGPPKGRPVPVGEQDGVNGRGRQRNRGYRGGRAPRDEELEQVGRRLAQLRNVQFPPAAAIPPPAPVPQMPVAQPVPHVHAIQQVPAIPVVQPVPPVAPGPDPIAMPDVPLTWWQVLTGLSDEYGPQDRPDRAILSEDPVFSTRKFMIPGEEGPKEIIDVDTGDSFERSWYTGSTDPFDVLPREIFKLTVTRRFQDFLIAFACFVVVSLIFSTCMDRHSFMTWRVTWDGQRQSQHYWDPHFPSIIPLIFGLIFGAVIFFWEGQVHCPYQFVLKAKKMGLASVDVRPFNFRQDNLMATARLYKGTVKLLKYSTLLMAYTTYREDDIVFDLHSLLAFSRPVPLFRARRDVVSFVGSWANIAMGSRSVNVPCVEMVNIANSATMVVLSLIAQSIREPLN